MSCTSNGSRASNPPEPNAGNHGSPGWCAPPPPDCSSTSSRASLSGWSCCCWWWWSGSSTPPCEPSSPELCTPGITPSICAPGTAAGGAWTAAGDWSAPCGCTLNSAMRFGNLYASCCSFATSAL
uniref:Uncharacterized protein n=1 Tax=Arundo donax TaxID=35708 RepID=A0A0A9I0Q5_ARUDO